MMIEFEMLGVVRRGKDELLEAMLCQLVGGLPELASFSVLVGILKEHGIIPYHSGGGEVLKWYHTIHDESVEACPLSTNFDGGKVECKKYVMYFPSDYDT